MIFYKWNDETDPKLMWNKAMLEHHVEQHRQTIKQYNRGVVKMLGRDFTLIGTFPTSHAYCGINDVHWRYEVGVAITIFLMIYHIGIIA